MEGWIKLHRKLLQSSLFNTSDAHLLQLFIFLLLSVNHEEKKIILNGEEIIVKKGQGVFGIKSIVFALTKCKYEKTNLFSKYKTLYYRKLKILEKLEILNIKSTNKYSLITINNWEQYQSFEEQVKNKRKTNEKQMNTNKNVKNVKKASGEKKNYQAVTYLQKIPVEDLQAFISKYTLLDENEIRLEAEKAYNWVVSKGYERKYTNFRHFFHNWLSRTNEAKMPKSKQTPMQGLLAGYKTYQLPQES